MIDDWDGRGAKGVPYRRLVAAELGGDPEALTPWSTCRRRSQAR
jgi:hypothetical protein